MEGPRSHAVVGIAGWAFSVQLVSTLLSSGAAPRPGCCMTGRAQAPPAHRNGLRRTGFPPPLAPSLASHSCTATDRLCPSHL